MTQDNREPKTGTLTQKEVLEILEPVRNPFMSVVKKSHFDLVWTRERDFAVQLMTKDDRFRKVLREDIVIAMKNLAFVGLSLNPVRQHATLIASYDKWAKRFLCRPMIMYRGLTFLATEAGVHGIKSEVVYRDDKFRHGSSSERGGDWYEYELNPLVDRIEANFVGVFVAARMPAGDLKVEWMPRKDVFKIRDQSDAYLDEDGHPKPNAPWVKWFDEMAKKADIRRASKHWEEMIGHTEKWDRFLKAVKLDNEAEGIIAPRSTDIDGKAEHKEEPPELVSEEQLTTLKTQAPGASFQKRICAAYNIPKLEQLPAARFTECLQRIETAKIEQQKAPPPAKKKGAANG